VGRRVKPSIVVLGGLFLVGLQSACFAEVWSLTTADFQTAQVQLHGMDDHGAAITNVSTQDSATVPWGQFLELSRSVTSAPSAGDFVLQLRNGDRLAGQPVSMTNDSVVWREATVGNLNVLLSSAIGFHRASVSDAAGAASTDDVAYLVNGDAVHGVLSDVNGNTISIQPAAGGDATAVPLTNVSSVVFAAINSATAPTPSGKPAFRIHLADHSVLTADSVHADESMVHLAFAAAPARDLPTADVQSIEQINGPVQWLSTLALSENIHTPYLQAAYPARFDRDALGGPISFADRSYTHGIGVHAYSKLTWVIPPEDHHFRTQYAVAGDLPYADLAVRISVDGQQVHWRSSFRAGELSPVIDLDLAGKHTLTLEVLDNQNAGVQARLNWIEPAFIRMPAATAP
jgi:hypothetical protein